MSISDMYSYKLLIPLFCSLLSFLQTLPQTVQERLRVAVKKFEADPQMRHAILSFEVANARTGAVVFERNSQTGLAPASCQKLFTSAAAFELLGPDYRFATKLGYAGVIGDGILQGDLFIAGSGDPTLGSARYAGTHDTIILQRWARAIERVGIRQVRGRILADRGRYGTQSIPNGWIWEDIDNYYGAGAWPLNWKENQYDLYLEPGDTVGALARVVRTDPLSALAAGWVSEVITAGPGSGDHANIYYPAGGMVAYVSGTIPLQKGAFVISGSIPNPPGVAAVMLEEYLDKGRKMVMEGRRDYISPEHVTMIDTFYSPRLDSINYWFLKKSINLYGEALLNTLGFEKTGMGSTEKGLGVLLDFWSLQGIERSAIHITDGSGLSPQNRVTTDALVKVMLFARTRPWFSSFYNSLPEINGMRMKSGSIGGARSYSGYQAGTDGKQYVFSVIVNNYDGSPGEVVKKLFVILNILKGG